MVNKNYFDISGKKAIVAGGAGDLGTVIVQALHDAGMQIVVLDRSKDLQEWVERIKKPDYPALIGIQADLKDRESLRLGFGRAVEVLAGIDLLVNCQGIQRRYHPEDFPLADWDEILETNLTSVFELCQLAGREMIRNGSGKIINIASMQSFNGGTNIPAYAASKSGVAILTKSLSNAWASKGVNVNAIAPGDFDTKMTAALKQNTVRYEQILSRIPIGRWAVPGDICGSVLFLASPAADYVSGVVLPVDGGMLGA